MIHRCALTLLAVCAVSVSLPLTAVAQDVDPKECFRGEKYADLINLLNRWNERELQLDKESFKDDFEQDVKRIASSNQKPHEWVDQRIALWQKLPPKLSFQKKLSVGSQMVILAIYDENADGFLKSYKEQKDREYRLKLKLYVILSLAQESAASAQEIRASDVLLAMQRGWTGLWPFCPEKASAPDVHRHE